MSHQFKVKRKDGKGWWILPHMDQDQIDGLTLGEDTDLHKHDQRYYTETEIDARLLDYLLLDGTRPMTGDLLTPGVTAIDSNGLRLTDDSDTLGIFIEDGGNVEMGGTLKLTSLTDNEGITLRHPVLSREGYIRLTSSGWLELATSPGNILLSNLTTVAGSMYLYDNTYLAFGTSRDISVIYSSVNDSLQIVSDYTVDTNIIAQFTDSGFELSAGVIVDSILDQDDFYSDSDTALATQQSIKAYIDNTTVALDGSRNMTGELEIYNASGGQLLELRDSGGSSADDALVWIRFRYGATTNLGVIGYGSTSDDDFYIQNEVGGVRISAAFTEQLNIQEDSITGKLIKDEDTLSSDSDVHLATQQSIKKYVDDKSFLDLGSILTVNETYVGTKITVTVDDASAIFGDVLAQAVDFNYDRADASAAANSVGLVMALSDGTGTKEVLIEGQVCDTDWDWNAGLLYLSVTTGKMTQSAPAGSGDQVVAVGWALSADTIYFKPSLVLAEIA